MEINEAMLRSKLIEFMFINFVPELISFFSFNVRVLSIALGVDK